MKVIGIIPARYSSSRFPGKPLAMIRGKTMIRCVYEQVMKSGLLNSVCVATDDSRIEQEVSGFGGNVIMTSEAHKSGTDRCMEAAHKLTESGKYFDVVINIQGDEPFIHPESINILAECFRNPQVEIATLAKRIEDNEVLFNPNVNKLIVDKDKNAIYFSRHPIPYLKNHEKSDWTQSFVFLKHIGIYGYRFDTLKALTHLEVSALEKAESLEQLRWIENGYKIHVEFTDFDSIGIDTPEDLLKIINNP